MPYSNKEISQKLGVPIENVNKYVPQLAAAMQAHHVTDKASAVAILATIKVETGSFQPIPEEGGGAQYEGRADLGNTQPGDGNRFMGRGFVQLTGRANYTEYGQKLGVDLVNHPELALDPKVSSEIMVQYCVDHNIPSLAQQGDWQGVRRAVNGGLNGWDTFSQAVQALNGGASLPMAANQTFSASSGGSSSGGGATSGASGGGAAGGVSGGSSGGSSAGGGVGEAAGGGSSGGSVGGSSAGGGATVGGSAGGTAASASGAAPAKSKNPATAAQTEKNLGLSAGSLSDIWPLISSIFDDLSPDETSTVDAMLKAALKGVNLKNPAAVLAAIEKVKRQMQLAGIPASQTAGGPSAASADGGNAALPGTSATAPDAAAPGSVAPGSGAPSSGAPGTAAPGTAAPDVDVPNAEAPNPATPTPAAPAHPDPASGVGNAAGVPAAQVIPALGPDAGSPPTG